MSTAEGPTIHSRFGVEFARMETHLESLARDFRYALRNLRKSRRFSLIAICALAFGDIFGHRPSLGSHRRVQRDGLYGFLADS